MLTVFTGFGVAAILTPGLFSVGLVIKHGDGCRRRKRWRLAACAPAA